MFTPLKLKKEVSETTADIDADDVLSVKQNLKRFGCYQEPEWGMTPITDNDMFKGISIYQRKSNLKQDRVMKPQGETETAINNELKRHKPAYLQFNGKEVSWHEDGQKKKSWTAMSGKKGYQCRTDTEITDHGPIPEGKWILRKGSGQHYRSEDLTWRDKLHFNSWKNKPAAWGNSRIKLEPAEDTDTKGRTDMYAHGGKELGSAGCIDLADGMEDFYKDFSRYDDDLIMNVKYDEECW